MSDDDPILICCPYCIRSLGTIDEPDAPFTVPAACPRCGMDPRNDAPLEMTLSQWGRMEKKKCPSCGASVPALSIQCGECKASTRAKKKTATAKKKTAPAKKKTTPAKKKKTAPAKKKKTATAKKKTKTKTKR